jgi:hypothetical protein
VCLVVPKFGTDQPHQWKMQTFYWRLLRRKEHSIFLICHNAHKKCWSRLFYFRLTTLNIASELAANRPDVQGPGTFRSALIDELYKLSQVPETIISKAKMRWVSLWVGLKIHEITVILVSDPVLEMENHRFLGLTITDWHTGGRNHSPPNKTWQTISSVRLFLFSIYIIIP